MGKLLLYCVLFGGANYWRFQCSSMGKRLLKSHVRNHQLWSGMEYLSCRCYESDVIYFTACMCQICYAHHHNSSNIHYVMHATRNPKLNVFYIKKLQQGDGGPAHSLSSVIHIIMFLTKEKIKDVRIKDYKEYKDLRISFMICLKRPCC